MKMRIRIYIAAVFMTTAVQAQNLSVKSTVMGTDGKPVSNAIVSVVGEKNSVLSDTQGTFQLKISDKDAIISIKAEGFYERIVPLKFFLQKQSGDGTVITLSSENDALTSARGTTTIESKDFSDKLSVGGALRDGIPGLQIIEKSGMPGEGTYMNIRGIHSFVAENNPLIVINGVPYLGNQNQSNIINAYSRDFLFGYSPRDIRSVTVLKGADAAMYGSLGSNGVILIETQQATSDNLETRISFSGQYGINLRKNGAPLLNSSQYKSYFGDVGLSRYSSIAQLTSDYPFMSGGTNRYNYLFNENTDWMKEIQHTGFMTENIFRVEGGDEIAKYNISFGYTNNTGTLKNTNTNRYHTLISADVLVSRKIDIFANLGLAYITSDLQNTGMTPEYNPLLAASRSMPLLSMYNKQEDGSHLGTLAAYDAWNVSALPAFAYDNTSNPMALVSTAEGGDKIYDANASIGLNWRPNDYLTFTGLLNLYYNYTEETMFIPGVTNRAILPRVYGTGQNYVANGVMRQQINNYQLAAKYNRTFNRVHELNALIQGRFVTRNIETDFSKGYNTANDFFLTLDATNNEKVSGGDNIEWNYMGWLLHADYTWYRMLKGSASLAIDGTSVTGADAARLGLFPSASLTFMAANTGWLPNFVNRLDLSVEASLSGNSRFSSNYCKNYYVSNNLYAIGSILRSNVPNAKLTWEKKRQIDFGIDASLFGGRLDLNVSAYYNQSYDLLLNRDISSVYGSALYYDNTGRINGRGIEVGFRVNPIHTRDFDMVLGANMATLNCKINSLGGDQRSVIRYKGYNNDDAQMVMAVGNSPYEFYGYKTNGVYATTAEAQADKLTSSNGIAYQAGDVRFVDQNHDGVINDADKVALGRTLPTLYGGINLMVRYKHVTLDANFGYTVGNHIYNAARRDAESMQTFYNQSTAVLNRWQVEGQKTAMPRAAYGDPAGNNAFSDRWVEKGDYLKLRSLRLSYQFDKLFQFVRSGNVFVSAENLFTLTKYLGTDPELAYSYDERLRGFDYAKMPLPITLKAGFNLNF